MVFTDDSVRPSLAVAPPDAPTPASGISRSTLASPAARTDGPKQLFVAHGKNRKPLDDLKNPNEFKIPYKVAIDEPNKGRPISDKVGS